MRNPGTLRLLLLVLAASALGACSGNTPVEPVLTIGGWSWAPDEAGDAPLPVLWPSGGAPVRLPVPPPGDCPSSGSVQALAESGGKVVAGGIGVRCSGGVPTMLPVAWPDATTLQLLPLAPRTTQGTVHAMATFDGAVYAAGAVGVDSPSPAIWMNGRLMTVTPAAFLPPGCDAAIVTSLIATMNFIAATGICHVTDSSPPAFLAAGWVLDTELQATTRETFPMPPDASGSVGPAAYVVLRGEQAVTTAAIVSPGGAMKTLAWLDSTPFTPFGLDFGASPFAAPTALAMSGLSPYSSGFIRSPAATSRPLPAIWAYDGQGELQTAFLPVLDAGTSLGAGEGLALFNDSAYVSGESCRPGTTSSSPVVCPPAWWANGTRGDLAPLVPSGNPLPVAAPVSGWWRVPGTPSTAPPDWPFPGGIPEILRSAPVAAAGSGVARVVLAVPP